jgi:hypothetical protein
MTRIFRGRFRRWVVLLAIVPGAVGLAIGTSAPAVRASTPSCGPSCVEPYSHEWGRHEIADAIGGGFGVQHQRVILFRASHDDGAEDFTYSIQGQVHTLASLGLLAPVTLLHYAFDFAFEVEYSPFGVDSGLCIGTWPSLHPASGWLLRLEPCGQGAWTIWIVDHFGTDGNSPGFGNVISGTTTVFSHPLVWTYPAGASPFDFPRPTITVRPLTAFSTGTHPDSQQWGATIGVEP